MAEKLQLATEESYRDPANIQSKHQKHQAFEAELAANADRIQVTWSVRLSFRHDAYVPLWRPISVSTSFCFQTKVNILALIDEYPLKMVRNSVNVSNGSTPNVALNFIK